MSLIEEALKKAVVELSVGGSQRPVLRDTRPAARTAVDMTQLQRYQPLKLDPEVLRANLILPEVTDPAAVRGYRILRTRVAQRMNANGWTSVGVTSLGVSEGKSLTAVNLARAMTRNVSHCVDLIDMDVQRPRIANSLGMTGGLGLVDYLIGKADERSIVYTPSGDERLSIVPNFTPMEQASEVVSSPRVDALFAWLRARTPQRMLICDLPPILSSDDVLELAPKLDCILLVVSEGQTQRNALANVNETLKGMNLLGVVLNRSTEQTAAGYAYY